MEASGKVRILRGEIQRCTLHEIDGVILFMDMRTALSPEASEKARERLFDRAEDIRCLVVEDENGRLRGANPRKLIRHCRKGGNLP